MKKIGLFGGTFNPIHRGHLLVAENAISAAGMDRVLFVPSCIPPHKRESDLPSGGERLEMVRLAIDGNPRMEALPIELERGGVSYSIDTVRCLRLQHPVDDVFFVLGSDNFADIGRWHHFKELAGMCQFLVIERPGCALPLPPPSVAPDQAARLKYTVFNGPTLDASSSEIRQLLRAGRRVSHLLPPSVEHYIRIHKLYRSSS